MIRLILTLAFTCVCTFVHAQVNIITTIAGTGTTGYSGDNGSATVAKLNSPHSLCFDNPNSLLFCDAFNSVVRKLELTTGIITTIAGTGVSGILGDGDLATNAQLSIPQGIIKDNSGNIYISDGLSARIRKIDVTSGVITTVAGTGVAGWNGDGIAATDAKLNQPVGLYVYNSCLYIADYGNKRIRKVDLTTGVILTVAGNGTVGYSGNGGSATTAQLNGGIDVAFDNVGNLYIADQKNGAVRKIDAATGIISTVAGNGTLGYSGDNGLATNGQLDEPDGLFLDAHNNLFIADYRNGAIRKVDLTTGIITTVAGGIEGYGGDNGPATNAKLKCVDVGVDVYRNIYISDYVNNRIRKVNNAVAVNGINKEIESKLYPNPTKGIFTIQTPIGISFVNIYNIAGLLVYEHTCTTTDTEIDITSLPSGVYMVYVQCGDKQYVSKVVKE